jgi:transcriptional regulator with XRE-family HTH domain
MQVPELIHQLLPRLRAERDWSTSVLSRMTVDAASHDEGVGEKTIQAIEKNAGRVPEARIIESLARALDIEPGQFYEWPIAVARRDSAATPEAERRRAVDAARKAAQRRADTRPTDQSGQRAKRGRGRAT